MVAARIVSETTITICLFIYLHLRRVIETRRILFFSLVLRATILAVSHAAVPKADRSSVCSDTVPGWIAAALPKTRASTH
jgi:hypothetical protein